MSSFSNKRPSPSAAENPGAGPSQQVRHIAPKNSNNWTKNSKQEEKMDPHSDFVKSVDAKSERSLRTLGEYLRSFS